MIQDRKSFRAALEEAMALLDLPPLDGTAQHAHFIRLLTELDHYMPDEPSLVDRARDLGLMRDAREDLGRRLQAFVDHHPPRDHGPEHGDNFAFGR